MGDRPGAYGDPWLLAFPPTSLGWGRGTDTGTGSGPEVPVNMATAGIVLGEGESSLESEVHWVIFELRRRWQLYLDTRHLSKRVLYARILKVAGIRSQSPSHEAAFAFPVQRENSVGESKSQEDEEDRKGALALYTTWQHSRGCESILVPQNPAYFV